MSELTIEQKLIQLADELEEIADFNEESDFSELGDWFMSWGSGEIFHVANKLRRIAKESK